jgi:hypothetical protein
MRRALRPAGAFQRPVAGEAAQQDVEQRCREDAENGDAGRPTSTIRPDF